MNIAMAHSKDGTGKTAMTILICDPDEAFTAAARRI